MYVSFALLAAAVLAGFVPRLTLPRIPAVPAWAVLFVAAAIAGLAEHVLTWSACIALALLFASGWAYENATALLPKTSFGLGAVLLALVLALHLAPGFHNPRLFVNEQLGPASAPVTQYLNFDKAAAGLALLVFLAKRPGTPVRFSAAARITVLAGVGTAVVALGGAWVVGYVHPELKVPHATVYWLIANLLFACVMEEALFRGVIQQRLSQALQTRSHLRHWVPVLVSALLFGLAHAAGGLPLVFFAALAGVGYSIAFDRSGSVAISSGAHFLVNAIHFLAFTFPFAVR